MYSSRSATATPPWTTSVTSLNTCTPLRGSCGRASPPFPSPPAGMMAATALPRSFGTYAASRGRVAREDGVPRRRPVELGENGTLQVKVLEDGLDDEIGAGYRLGEIRGPVHAGLRFLSFRLAQLPLLDATHDVTTV